MAKVILICGKICCGKSTYAKKLKNETQSIILSVDEISLSLFGQHCGDNHDIYTKAIQNYLFNKSLEIIDTGINVILDWGFWTSKERTYAREFYRNKSIECELHFIDIDNETWRKRIEKRNIDITTQKAIAYYIDDTLFKKSTALFEPPTKEETDIMVKS